MGRPAAGGVGGLSVRLSRRPATGRTRRRLGARPSLRLRPRNTPGGWRGSGKPKGPPQNDRTVGWWCGGAGSRPGRAASTARRRRAHAGRVGELKVVAGFRLLRLRRGRSGSEMVATPVGGLRSVDGCAGHPASRRSGQAEQTTARPASVRPSVKAVLTWRAGRRPAPQKGGPTADGMNLQHLSMQGTVGLTGILPERTTFE